MASARALLLILCLAGCHAPPQRQAAAVPPPLPPEFCAQSLGRPDCFADPALLPDHPEGLADGPWRLTPEQEADKRAWWRFWDSR